jgi:hypothetical protein
LLDTLNEQEMGTRRTAYLEPSSVSQMKSEH